MGTDNNTHIEQGGDAVSSARRPLHDLEQQCLRVLRCTAKALAHSPGGLRFQAGTKPWLDAITDCAAHLSYTHTQRT